MEDQRQLLDGQGQTAVEEQPDLVPEGQRRAGVLRRRRYEIPGQVALGDDRLPARPVGQTPSDGVAREIVVELEGAHAPLDLDVGPRRRYRHGASPSGPPGRLLFGAGQPAKEQQLVDVEQRLGKVPQEEAPASAGGADRPAPQRHEIQRRPVVRPRSVRIHFLNVADQVVVAVQRRIGQRHHVHLFHLPAEEGCPHRPRFVHPLRPPDVNFNVFRPQIAVQFVYFGLKPIRIS